MQTTTNKKEAIQKVRSMKLKKISYAFLIGLGVATITISSIFLIVTGINELFSRAIESHEEWEAPEPPQDAKSGVQVVVIHHLWVTEQQEKIVNKWGRQGWKVIDRKSDSVLMEKQ
jgi:hypothetical protein